MAQDLTQSLLELKITLKVPNAVEKYATELIKYMNTELEKQKKSKNQGLGKKLIKQIKNIFLGKSENENEKKLDEQSIKDSYKKLKRWYLKYYEDKIFREKASKCIREYEKIYGIENSEDNFYKENKDLSLGNSIKLEINLCKTILNDGEMSKEFRESKDVIEIVNKLIDENKKVQKGEKEWEDILNAIKIYRNELEKAKKNFKKEIENKAKKEIEERKKQEAEKKAIEKAQREAEEKEKKEIEEKKRIEAEKKAEESTKIEAQKEAEKKIKEEAKRKAKEEAEKAQKAEEKERKKVEEEAKKKAREEAEKEKAREELDEYWVFDWNMGIKELKNAIKKEGELKKLAGSYGKYILRTSVQVKELAKGGFKSGSLSPQYDHKGGDGWGLLRGPYYILVDGNGNKYPGYKYGTYDCLNRTVSENLKAEEEALQTLENIYNNGGKYVE